MRIWGSERSLAERHDLVSETSGCVGGSSIGGPATGPRYPCAVITLFGAVCARSHRCHRSGLSAMTGHCARRGGDPGKGRLGRMRSRAQPGKRSLVLEHDTGRRDSVPWTGGY